MSLPPSFDRAQLLALSASVRDAAGAEGADDLLFRIGLRWGKRTAAELGAEPVALRERVVVGLTRFSGAGLGTFEVEELACDPEHETCRIVGRVRQPLESDLLGCPDGRLECSPTGLTAGFMTGLVSSVTGFDVVCTPLACPATAGVCSGCSFEIRAAHEVSSAAARHAPPGSARFFLGSLGRILAETDVSLDDVLESTPDAIVLIDNDEVVRYWNLGAQQMFQFTPAEVVGRRIGAIIPKDLLDSDEIGSIRRKLERGEPVVNFVTRRVRKDGEERIVDMTRTPLHDSNGRVVGSTAILRDITDQRRTAAELERARAMAMIGEMAAKMAHEIKNPLASIQAAVQMLARDLGRGDQRRDLCDEVVAEVKRLDQTVIDLLRFARPLPPKLEVLDLREFVTALAAPLRRQFPAAELRLDVAPGCRVPIDARLMSQVFENLMLNALQAMEGHGTLIVEAREHGEDVSIEVRDTGPGIAPEFLATIFEPFFTTKIRGTGLGLAIARKNVETHGGALAARNNPRGGACFQITLKRAATVLRGA